MIYTACRRNPLLVFAALFLFAVPGFASDQGPDATALFNKGRAMSDIWAEGIPFRLESRFRLVHRDKPPVQGTYVQFWVPPENSREEITLPGYKEIIVRKGNRAYYQPSSVSELFPAFLVRRAVNLRSHFDVPAPWKIDGVIFREEDKRVQVKCVAASNPMDGFDELCLDPAREYVLSEYELSTGFWYSRHTKFGSKFFPRMILVGLDGGVRMEVEIENLAEDASFDAALFEPPPGAQVSAWCEHPFPAQEIVGSVRVTPRGSADKRLSTPRTPVKGWTIVGTDGRLHNPTITRTFDRTVSMAAFDEEMNEWRYKPAVCGTSPVETWVQFVATIAQSD